MLFPRLDDSPMFRKQLLALEESAEQLRERCSKLHKHCRKYSESMGDAENAELAFAHALDTFSGSDDDTLGVSVGGPVLSKFITAMRELRAYRGVLRTQVDYMLSDRVAQFKDVDLQNLKDVRKRYDKARQAYNQARERFLSLKKDAKPEVMADAEENLKVARHEYEQARFAVVTMLSNIDSKKKFEFIESVGSTMDAHLRYFKQSYELLHELEPYIHQVLTFSQQARERAHQEQTALIERMQAYMEEKEVESMQASSLDEEQAALASPTSLSTPTSALHSGQPGTASAATPGPSSLAAPPAGSGSAADSSIAGTHNSSNSNTNSSGPYQVAVSSGTQRAIEQLISSTHRGKVVTIKQGYLLKRSSNLRGDWKRRFFVLDSRGMLYYCRKMHNKPSGVHGMLQNSVQGIHHSVTGLLHSRSSASTAAADSQISQAAGASSTAPPPTAPSTMSSLFSRMLNRDRDTSPLPSLMHRNDSQGSSARKRDDERAERGGERGTGSGGTNLWSLLPSASEPGGTPSLPLDTLLPIESNASFSRSSAYGSTSSTPSSSPPRASSTASSPPSSHLPLNTPSFSASRNRGHSSSSGELRYNAAGGVGTAGTALSVTPLSGGGVGGAASAAAAASLGGIEGQEDSDSMAASEHALNLLTATLKMDAEQSELRFCFRIVSPARTYTLQAESAAERQEWMDTITAVIASLLNAQMATPAPRPRSSALPFDPHCPSLLLSSHMYGSNNSLPSPAALSLSSLTPSSRPSYVDRPLDHLQSVTGNLSCAECTAAGPDWASLNLGILMCIECSGVHRNMGVHISKVRSLTLDVRVWEPPIVCLMQAMGNEFVNSVWEERLRSTTLPPHEHPSGPPPAKPSPKDSLQVKERFIQAKYVDRRFIIDGVDRFGGRRSAARQLWRSVWSCELKAAARLLFAALLDVNMTRETAMGHGIQGKSPASGEGLPSPSPSSSSLHSSSNALLDDDEENPWQGFYLPQAPAPTAAITGGTAGSGAVAGDAGSAGAGAGGAYNSDVPRPATAGGSRGGGSISSSSPSLPSPHLFEHINLSADDGSSSSIALPLPSPPPPPGMEDASPGCRLLHVACWRGSAVSVELLLQFGADVSAGDREGRTPLHWCLLMGHADCAKQLIARGADLKRRDKAGRTAFESVMERGGGISDSELLLMLMQ